MHRILVSLVCGTLFGLGLAVSRMVDPAKVLGFLDVAGVWDPTLAFVMAGAVAVMAPAARWSRRLQRPVLAEAFDRPAKTAIDARLIGGALLFGVGWGLVGFCPGPAIASLAYGLAPSLVFVAAMAAGMGIHRLIER
jgi:uncharacterized membrane protein YedE/YeeE